MSVPRKLQKPDYPGPYFPGQKSGSPCRCYYPDVTLVLDDRKKKKRILLCKTHGRQVLKLTDKIARCDVPGVKAPTEAWRAEEKERLRRLSFPSPEERALELANLREFLSFSETDSA